ncbi:hypothetical protein ACOJB9_15935 [Carnobacterium maltaromaticum]|uniref:hypothetical protein n=1 Tax=Carnobacterium maltaromaticum TaxID=2751 RepID=UPI003C20C830
MKKLFIASLTILGLLTLGACTNNNTSKDTSSSEESAPTAFKDLNKEEQKNYTDFKNSIQDLYDTMYRIDSEAKENNFDIPEKDITAIDKNTDKIVSLYSEVTQPDDGDYVTIEEFFKTSAFSPKKQIANMKTNKENLELPQVKALVETVQMYSKKKVLSYDLNEEKLASLLESFNSEISYKGIFKTADKALAK